MIKYLLAKYPKLALALSILALVVLSSHKVLFATWVHAHVASTVADFTDTLLPMFLNLVEGALFFLSAYLVYAPAARVVSRCAAKTSASERGRSIISRSFQLLFWGATGFIGISLVAPDLVSKLFLGFSIFSAALALSLQGVARDFISGVFLHFSPKFDIGDSVATQGTTTVIAGKVKDVGYLSTYIDVGDGVVVMSNGDMWSTAVKVSKPGAEPAKGQ